MPLWLKKLEAATTGSKRTHLSPGATRLLPSWEAFSGLPFENTRKPHSKNNKKIPKIKKSRGTGSPRSNLPRAGREGQKSSRTGRNPFACCPIRVKTTRFCTPQTGLGTTHDLSGLRFYGCCYVLLPAELALAVRSGGCGGVGRGALLWHIRMTTSVTTTQNHNLKNLPSIAAPHCVLLRHRDAGDDGSDGASIIRIGFGCTLYYKYNKEPPEPHSNY